ncbi:MAG: hypothetical protein RBS88_08740 [Spongiibacteraceae bacterium]|jgi:hypothetical protein|nr:hypothetical protein [Spongiibacteraceae bacterium]
MISPASPPSPARLLKTTLVSLLVAVILLVLVVLPAEFGIDPTGFGRLTGLTAMHQSPARTIAIRDVTGGNENLREVAIPDAGEPTPLPNPAVFQDSATAPATRTLTIELPAESQTEVKLVMQEAKVALFSWSVDRGPVYVDMHGHDPAFGPDFFVRYKEEDESSGGHGSLTAPFRGEHGWFWLNYNEFPVTITLTVSGYFDDLVDYGLFAHD